MGKFIKRFCFNQARNLFHISLSIQSVIGRTISCHTRCFKWQSRSLDIEVISAIILKTSFSLVGTVLGFRKVCTHSPENKIN